MMERQIVDASAPALSMLASQGNDVAAGSRRPLCLILVVLPENLARTHLQAGELTVTVPVRY